MGKGVSADGGLVSEWGRPTLEWRHRGCRLSGCGGLKGPLRGGGTTSGVAVLSHCSVRKILRGGSRVNVRWLF